MKQYIYEIMGDLTVTRESGKDVRYIQGLELLEKEEAIIKYLDANKDNLANYIHEDSSLHGIVEEITVGVAEFEDRFHTVTNVVTNQALSISQKIDLINFLEGQFSDGYGESLEQTPFETYDWEDLFIHLDNNLVIVHRRRILE